jgi:CrcB protein
MIKIFLIGTGGFIGTITRYACTIGISRLSHEHWFPLGTLTVNATGCFMIGLLGGLVDTKNLFTDNIRLFLFTGILGGFTTFSAFSYETLTLANNSHNIAAILNVFLQIAVCLSAAWLGNNLIN